MFNQAYNPAPHIKVKINVGACLDIPTAEFVQGRRGEMIMNGGLSPITGFTGIPNSFKTKLLEYNMLKAVARMGRRCSGIEYDSEANKEENHVREVARAMPEFMGFDPFEPLPGEEYPRMVITDKNEYTGDEFYALFKESMEKKRKSGDKILVETPFWNRKMDGPFRIPMPSTSAIDSFSAFETKDVIEIQDANDLGDSGANTLHMRQGLVKQRLLMEAPRLNNGNYNYMLMTAHLGKESTMQKGAGGKEVPVTKLSTLKNGDALKGVTGYFLSITQNLWMVTSLKPLVADDGNGPKFPRDSTDKAKYDTDLQQLTVKNLRGKSGASGMPNLILASQSEGILDSLTEFYNCMENGRFGFEGNNTNYQMTLLPDVTLSRTTVRGKLKTNALLRRAVNIQSELCQMHYHFRELTEYLCTPKELYDDLKAAGYDWNLLLQSRGWWTIIENEVGLPGYLSILDLLRMRKGEYHPYWLEADKKTVKKEYRWDMGQFETAAA